MNAALWPDVIGRLLRREDLPDELVEQAMAAILSGDATDAQIAGFAVALRAKGETAAELATLVRTMLRVRRARRPHRRRGPIVDTCGTGGDGAGTVNVSTMAALVTAASGARVAKHGGRAASSKCGSVDVLESLGVVIDLGPDGVARCVREVGIGFCFAQRYHPAMRFAAPVRRELGTPTTFNFLGPLANPAGATRRTVGVSDPVMAERVIRTLATPRRRAGARVLRARRARRAHRHHHVDRLRARATARSASTTSTPSTSASRAPSSAPSPAATRRATPQAVHQVFAGAKGPIRDIVTLNAAAALLVADVVPDLGAGVELAAGVIDDGRAAATLEAFVRVSVAARESGIG